MGPLHGCRILIVEDEELVAMVLEDVLVEAGAVVVGSAASVASALAILAGDPPIDAAVLDINLGGEISEPIAAVLAGRGVPFLFATGYHNHPLARTASQPVLLKPYTPADLVAALRAICPS